MNGIAARWIAPLGAVALVAILLLGAGAAGACTPPPTSPVNYTLATIPLIDAIAANSTEVFAQGVTNCSQIWGVTASGNVSVYATLPVANSACDEGALALTPLPVNCTENQSTGGWGQSWGGNWGKGGNGNGCRPCGGQSTSTQDILYDVVAGELFEITNGGANVTQVAKFYVSHNTSENLGLAYDQVGLFDHDLIITSSAGGKVWLYNITTANTSLLTQLFTYIGGPAVAPLNFGTYGGDVLIAEKRMGEVVAVTPSGSVSNVSNWSKSNAVAFPPASGWGGCGSSTCSFGSHQEVLFVANYTSGALEAFPSSDLRNFGGDGFVAGGLNQGIAAFNSAGSTTLFASQTQKISDIASITCFSQSRSGGHGHGGWGW
jgi:hypothetical protein